jgi:hypothetical protein
LQKWLKGAFHAKGQYPAIEIFAPYNWKHLHEQAAVFCKCYNAAIQLNAFN